MPLTPPASISKGPYDVSTLEIEIPVRDPRVIAEHFKIGGQPVFKLDSVLVTLFYPAAKGTTKSGTGTGWLSSPRLKTIEGLLKYAGMSKYLALPVVLPAYSLFFAKLPLAQNAPLAPTAPLEQDSTSSSKTFPVGVFSHGLGGNRTTYSQYLAALASQGFVVAAVESRDGSGPASTIHYASSSGKKPETKLFFKHAELDKDEDGKDIGDVWALRRAQLELRQAEVLEAIHVLSRLNEGQGSEVEAESTRVASSKPLGLAEWKARLDLQSPWALGHSFGGATVIELLRKTDSPFARGLVLDPWVEPIAKVADGAPIKKPLYCINSDHFTVWRTHMRDVRALLSQSKRESGHGWLLTVTKTKHTDFSDFPALLPRVFSSAVPAEAALRLFAEASSRQFVASSLGKSDEPAQLLDGISLPLRAEKEGECERKNLGDELCAIYHDLDVDAAPAHL